jgi:lipid-A-disaccharide synthase
LIVAGEASGDLHAAGVADELARRRPDLTLVGVGGERMARAGVTLVERTDRLAVMGFAEVLRTIPRHYALLRSLGARLRSGSVSALVTIDYPGFNIRLAGAARRAGVPVLYYITPQVWAWGEARLPTLARVITKAAVILPFEESLLRAHGIDATFVGHPLLDRATDLPSRESARHRLGLPGGGRVLALFPGSRQQEIERHVEIFTDAASRLVGRFPDLRVVVSAAAGVRIDPRRCPFPQVRESSLVLLRAADAALCKSGTTTLEAAVAECPLVVGYRTSRWTHAIARRVVTIPRIGLVNVVAGREVAPEFVQDALSAEAITRAVAPLLEPSSAERRTMLAGLRDVRLQLGTPGAAERVAGMISGLAA